MKPLGNPVKSSPLGRYTLQTVQLWDAGSFRAFETQEVLDIASDNFH